MIAFADKVIAGAYNVLSLIVKITSEVASALSASAAATIQYFVHLSFNATFQLLNDISSDIQTLATYFNGRAVVLFFRIPSLSFGAG